MELNAAFQADQVELHTYVLQGFTIGDLSAGMIAHLSLIPASEEGLNRQLTVKELGINRGVFTTGSTQQGHPEVTVEQPGRELRISCGCGRNNAKLCEHQAHVLFALIRHPDLCLFFDERRRLEQLEPLAKEYGLDEEAHPEQYFRFEYAHQQITIRPVNPSMLPVTPESLSALHKLLVPAKPLTPATYHTDQLTRCMVLKQHKYYKHLLIELYDAPLTKEGKLKNPLTPVNIHALIWATGNTAEIRFYTAITRFQQNINPQKTAHDINSLYAIVSNPLQLPVYYHNNETAEKISAGSLIPTQLQIIQQAADLVVQKKAPFYELSGTLQINKKAYALNDLQVVFGFFLLLDEKLYLTKDLPTLEWIHFFRKRPGSVLIHASKYKAFKAAILDKLEDQQVIAYPFIKPATPAQLDRNGFNTGVQKLIYLADAGLHVLLIPVMKYGEVEIPVRSKKQIYAADEKGNEFLVKRDQQAEIAFTALITRQHPDFEEQLENDLSEFYLHRKHFLDENWFLEVFEEWQNKGIQLLGFNEIRNNKLNPHKAKITVQVISGINWFNTVVKMKFGKQKASLKAIHKALKDKSKFVLLDDGTQGMIPAEWIEKLSAYFHAADITEADLLRTPKINYSTISALYDTEMLSKEVQEELQFYQQQLADMATLKETAVPAELQAELRPYQKHGLNWLNFLDDLNFGGCLADDMGLGKTVQIIAFILSQRKKVVQNTNLLVVPTSLIFNWQAEIEKFAPSIKVLTLHGAGRPKTNQLFEAYELILTSYGTLLSDIGFIKNYPFNYIFLDESQHIKNPESQRYKAVRLLQSRNKIAITGTPFENNTFDIYGQLSFACPGLLGSKKYFSDVYSNPIDKFKVSRRARELQDKIRPFILRRTKQQVASELPDKTEMTLYCEMGEAQQKTYDAFEKEFREFISATTQEELPKKSIYVLKGLTRLRQICNSPLLLKEETIRETASTKIEVLMEQIESKAPRHKMLVFSQFVSMLDLIKEALDERQIGYAWLTGSTRNRDLVVDRFQNDPSVRIFLISLKAGGTGLNLTAADYVYLVDPWWNPAVENQAIDRSYRIGQHKNVIAARLICTGTVEEKMLKLQEAKMITANKILREDSSFAASLTKADLLHLAGGSV